MGDPSGVEALRAAMRQALQAQDALLQAWRRCGLDELARQATEDDIDILRQLINHRIDPVNAFALLARLDRSSALQALIDRYVGTGVDPDTKFGGYTFELSAMLDDLREVHGETSLRALVARADFNRAILSDPRVIEAFTDALNIQPEQFARWLGGRPSGDECGEP